MVRRDGTTGAGDGQAPSFPDPFSEDGIEASAIRSRLEARLFGAPSQIIRIGRYEVVDKIGAGGMGIVYSARDPDLGRNVALKVLEGRRGGDPRHRQRLIDEARTLARVSHPNVVQIHEVGVHDGSVFLALELVEGENLALWQRRPGRRWRAVLEAYLDAARGLGAVHSVGIVHGDVKPANVLVGAEGRVRVVDFGLAHAELGDVTGDDDDARSQTLSGSDLGVAGTPDYMSPEQASGEPLDPRSDVFSLSVSLFEGLTGRRPFERLELRRLRAQGSLGSAELRALIPRGRTVPSWIVRELARGLQPDPAQRFPSMEALIRAFEDSPRRVRRRRQFFGGMLGAVALGGAMMMFSSQAPRCPEVVEEIPDVWDDEVRATIEERFLASDLTFAPLAWETLSTSLDEAVAAWSRKRREVCLETKIDGSRSDEYYDLASECLRRYEGSLESLTRNLLVADDSSITEAYQLVDELGDLKECYDVEMLRRGPERPPPQLQGRVAELQREIDGLRYQILTDNYEPAASLGDALVVSAEIHEPLLAEALYLRGVVDYRRGKFEEAEGRLRDAYGLAEAVEDDRLAAEVLGTLTDLMTERRGDLGEARAYAALDGAKLRRLGAEGSVLAAHHDRLGKIALVAGEPTVSLSEYSKAASLRPEEDSVGRAESQAGIADAQAELGHYGASILLLAESQALLRAELGPGHPATARVSFNLAVSLIDSPDSTPEEYRSALQLLRVVLDIDLRHGGERSLHTARTRVALARVLSVLEAPDDAHLTLSRALTTLRGMGHTPRDDLIAALRLEINIAIDRNDWSAASVSTATLIGMLRERGERVPLDILINAGEFHRLTGDPVAATPYYDAALIVAFAEGGPDNVLLIYALNGRAAVYLRRDDPLLAQALYERAIPLLSALEDPPPELQAEVYWGESQALTRSGVRPSEARRLAGEALVLYEKIDPTAADIQEIRAFLRVGMSASRG